jgi:DNA-binding response OmpR family regulator
MTPKKVVLADDEAHLGHLIKFKLERSGFVVIWKTDGVQALEAVRSERPDAVVLDVMMPGLSGYEVLEQIKADPDLKGIPVVMLTAQSQEGDILRGIKLGAADYITKPFRPAELVARVMRLFPET